MKGSRFLDSVPPFEWLTRGTERRLFQGLPWSTFTITGKRLPVILSFKWGWPKDKNHLVIEQSSDSLGWKVGTTRESKRAAALLSCAPAGVPGMELCRGVCAPTAKPTLLFNMEPDWGIQQDCFPSKWSLWWVPCWWPRG